MPGVEGSISDFSVLGGGERVRLCNPCVPDPNTTPPQTQRSSQPTVADGRPTRTRLSSNSVGDYSTGPRPHSRHVPHGYTHSRTRSATTVSANQEHYIQDPDVDVLSHRVPAKVHSTLASALIHPLLDNILILIISPILRYLNAGCQAQGFNILLRQDPLVGILATGGQLQAQV